MIAKTPCKVGSCLSWAFALLVAEVGAKSNCAAKLVNANTEHSRTAHQNSEGF